MSVKCPFCSTMLTVQSKRNTIQEPIAPRSQVQISCPGCSHAFTVTKTGGPIQLQCPGFGVKGTFA